MQTQSITTLFLSPFKWPQQIISLNVCLLFKRDAYTDRHTHTDSHCQSHWWTNRETGDRLAFYTPGSKHQGHIVCIYGSVCLYVSLQTFNLASNLRFVQGTRLTFGMLIPWVIKNLQNTSVVTALWPWPSWPSDELMTLQTGCFSRTCLISLFVRYLTQMGLNILQHVFARTPCDLDLVHRLPMVFSQTHLVSLLLCHKIPTGLTFLHYVLALTLCKLQNSEQKKTGVTVNSELVKSFQHVEVYRISWLPVAWWEEIKLYWFKEKLEYSGE